MKKAKKMKVETEEEVKEKIQSTSKEKANEVKIQGSFKKSIEDEGGGLYKKSNNHGE